MNRELFFKLVLTLLFVLVTGCKGGMGTDAGSPDFSDDGSVGDPPVTSSKTSLTLSDISSGLASKTVDSLPDEDIDEHYLFLCIESIEIVSTYGTVITLNKGIGEFNVMTLADSSSLGSYEIPEGTYSEITLNIGEGCVWSADPTASVNKRTLFMAVADYEMSTDFRGDPIVVQSGFTQTGISAPTSISVSGDFQVDGGGEIVLPTLKIQEFLYLNYYLTDNLLRYELETTLL